MCGIAGIAGPAGVDVSRHLPAMRDALVHRGPDGEGLESWPEDGVALGHRRLSILDLSDAGAQPMCNEDGSVWVVFNGEVYNSPELRRELQERGHRFASRTDTEVLVHGYEEWACTGSEAAGDPGIERFLSRLTGMFAFALWDRRRRCLLLVRDRLGIKPLYYVVLPESGQQGERLLFASELKALLAHPDVPRTLDQRAVLDYLAYGYVPGDGCILSGPRKLPAAHYLLWNAGDVEVRRYWSLAEPDFPEPGAEELRALLTTAARDHLLSDVPLGCFLSGGVDSTLITALTSDVAPPDLRLRTVSVGFDAGSSELPQARRTAERHGTEHHEEHVSVDMAEDLFPQLARTWDEPLADVSTLPTLRLCQAARRHVKVALSGDGGDELFAGYGWYRASLRTEARSNGGLGRVATRLQPLVDPLRGVPYLARLGAVHRHLELDPLLRHHYLRGLFDPWELQRLAGSELRGELAHHDPLWLWKRWFRPELPLLTALQVLDIHTYLVDDILVKVDRASMAHSLEVRPPLLDHRVAELALRIPAGQQLQHGQGKAFLRQAAGDLLPRDVFERPKRGFSPPVRHWFRSGSSGVGLWHKTRDTLLHGRLVGDGLLDAVAVERMVRYGTERRWSKVWALLTLEHWTRAWL